MRWLLACAAVLAALYIAPRLTAALESHRAGRAALWSYAGLLVAAPVALVAVLLAALVLWLRAAF